MRGAMFLRSLIAIISQKNQTVVTTLCFNGKLFPRHRINTRYEFLYFIFKYVTAERVASHAIQTFV